MIKTLKKYIRPLIPFPKKKTLARLFPSLEDQNIGYLIKKYDIDTVIDIGANKGQFAEKIRSVGYKGKIISFEPLKEEHTILTYKSRKDKNWIIAPRMALGSTTGEIMINITHDTSLSSINSTLDKSLIRTTESVRIEPLDQAIKSFISSPSKILVKIDVQGLEPQVLSGATKILKKAKALMLEVGLIPVYENEIPYIDLLSWLRKKGFHAVHFSSVISKKKLGETYQLDTFLVKNPPRKFTTWDTILST